MNLKILTFGGWVFASWNAANFLALFLKHSPAISFGALLALAGLTAIGLTIAWFAPSTRPWLSLIALIIFLGGLAWVF